jgi:hypothetical protein
MSKTLKWSGIIIALLITVNVARVVVTKSKEALTSPDGKYDVVDGLVGRVGVDKFLEIKEERDTFNLPAFRTSLMMYQTQHGRFPTTMEEFESSGEVSPEITRDHWGKPYKMKIINDRSVLLHGSGKDKIQGTTDDVDYKIDL